ncbi:DNA polymerase I A [Durusdinium trenchii]|uniref:Chloroplastic/mitochondrial n=1 Tax=Durusdinium trenchii TaxID=1381693 RepID=A0ABP0SNF4_9DINO
MGVMDLRLGDCIPEAGEKKCCCCCCSCTFFVVFILLLTSFQQVNRLNAGLLRNGFTGEVNLERSYLPGRYFVGFWHEFLHFPTTLNTIEFADEAVEDGVQMLGKLRSRDKDGKQIWLDVSVQYRIYPQELPQIYREMTKLYEDVYISELRGALQRVTNEFTIDQAWKDYATVQKKMHDICKEVLTVRHADCWGLQLWGIRLQVEYENQLIRTQVRKQAEETALARQTQTTYRQKTEVILAEYVANVTVIQQKGQADKQRIERDAVSAARSALVTAQGEVLNLVRGIVKVNATDTVPERLMTGSDLAKYQRVLMFKEKALSNFELKNAGV